MTVASSPQLENQTTKHLLRRLIGWGLFSQTALIFLLFVIPGTADFWQGWAFSGVNLVVMIIFGAYFFKYDRELLARRMLRKEKAGAQKVILLLLKILAFLRLPGV